MEANLVVWGRWFRSWFLTHIVFYLFNYLSIIHCYQKKSHCILCIIFQNKEKTNVDPAQFQCTLVINHNNYFFFFLNSFVDYYQPKRMEWFGNYMGASIPLFSLSFLAPFFLSFILIYFPFCSTNRVELGIVSRKTLCACACMFRTVQSQRETKRTARDHPSPSVFGG